MAILLAYNITPESPSKPPPTRTLSYPVTPVPSPPRPLSPNPPPPTLLPPVSLEATVIPLPRGRKIAHAPAEDTFDAETRFNTQYNTRRSAAVFPASASVSKVGKGKRVGFKKDMVSFIPPPCLDLVLYGQREPEEPKGRAVGRRWVEWVLAMLLAAVMAVGLVECGRLGAEWAAPVLILGQNGPI